MQGSTTTPCGEAADLKEALIIGLAALGYLNPEQTDKHWNTLERKLREIETRANFAPSAELDIPLCAGHADSWFCARNHLKGDTSCVVCAFDQSASAPSAGVPCDMGEMCLDCQPRGLNGECPDAPQSATVQSETIELLREVRKSYVGHLGARMDAVLAAAGWTVLDETREVTKEQWDSLRSSDSTAHQCTSPGAVLHGGKCPECGKQIIPPRSNNAR